MIGGFYGVTAPMLLFMNLRGRELRGLISALDNDVDRHIITNLSYEISKLKEVINYDYEYVYKNPKDRLLNVRYKASEKFYATGEGNAKISRNEMESTKLYLQNAEKTLNPKIGDVTLSDNACKVLSYLLDNSDKLDKIENSLKLSASEEVEFLGLKLQPRLNYKQNFFEISVYRKFEENKNQKQVFYDSLKKDLKILDDIVDDTVNSSFSSERKLILSTEELDKSKNLLISDSLKNNPKILRQILALRDMQKSLNDNMDKELNLNLSMKEYQSIFEELHSIGCIGFNIYTEYLFEDALKLLSFSQPKPLKITKEQDIYDFREILRKFLLNNKECEEEI